MSTLLYRDKRLFALAILMILSAGIFSHINRRDLAEFPLQTLLLKSAAVSNLAQRIAENATLELDENIRRPIIEQSITRLEQAGIKSVTAIGDCHAPGTVAAAVYDGHSAARHLQSGIDIYAPLFVRDMPRID